MNFPIISHFLTAAILILMLTPSGIGAEVSKEIVAQRLRAHLDSALETVIGRIGETGLLREAKDKTKRDIFIEETVGILRDDGRSTFSEVEADTIVADSNAFIVSFGDALLKDEKHLRERLQTIRKKAAASRVDQASAAASAQARIASMTDDLESIRSALDEELKKSTLTVERKFIPDHVIKRAEDLAYVSADFSASANLDYYMRQYLGDCVRIELIENIDNVRFFIGNYFCAYAGLGKIGPQRLKKNKDEIRTFIRANLPFKKVADSGTPAIDFTPDARAVIRTTFQLATEFCWASPADAGGK